MKLDEMLGHVYEQIPKVDDSLKEKIFNQTMIEKDKTKPFFIRNLKSMVVICLSLCLVLLITLHYVFPSGNNLLSDISISVYAKSEEGYQIEKLINENVSILGEYSFPMDVLPGLPITFDSNDSSIEINVDNGQFLLWHDYKIITNDNGIAVFTPQHGEKSGLENLGKSYLIKNSSTIYWIPYESDHGLVIENALINYKIIQNKVEITSGQIIIEETEGLYTVTLKQN